MKGFVSAIGGIALTASSVTATPSLFSEPANNLAKRATSCNTASNRTCWTDDGFDISTNYMENTPTTNVTRKYTIYVSQVENLNLDGTSKPLSMLINGTYPGPTLYADWGDEFEITVVNNLTNNGTSMHWHGIVLTNNNIMDGVNGITECPTAPGYNKTYKFRAEQYGTTWYHSHFSTQYGNGAFGPMIINGPASANYDIDLGPYPIGDYLYETAEEIYAEYIIPSPGVGPSPDNILFNGSAVNADGDGAYDVVTLTPNMTHRLRLINPSVDSELILTLNQHNFTVISTDLVPIEPYETDQLFLAIGQRLDVLITADQAVDNYWFNVTWPSTGLCGSSKVDYPASIFRYEGADESNPTDQGSAPSDVSCDDVIDFVPYVSVTVPSENFADEIDGTLDVTTTTHTWHDVESRVYWTVNASDMNITWGYPTLAYLRDDVTDYPTRLNALEVNANQTWSYWVITNALSVPHPMHLHGHDFYILGSSGAQGAATTFNATTDLQKLNFENPTRRDVAMLPQSGWLVLAFENNNPGAWVMHCHIAWHVGSGLSVQFLESMDTVKQQFDLDTVLEPTCTEWNAYNEDAVYQQEDSGL